MYKNPPDVVRFLNEYLITSENTTFFKNRDLMISSIVDKMDLEYKETIFLYQRALHFEGRLRSKKGMMIRSTYCMVCKEWKSMDYGQLLEVVHKVIEQRIRKEGIIHQLALAGVPYIQETLNYGIPKAEGKLLKTKGVALKRFEKILDEEFLILKRR